MTPVAAGTLAAKSPPKSLALLFSGDGGCVSVYFGHRQSGAPVARKTISVRGVPLAPAGPVDAPVLLRSQVAKRGKAIDKLKQMGRRPGRAGPLRKPPIEVPLVVLLPRHQFDGQALHRPDVIDFHCQTRLPGGQTHCRRVARRQGPRQAL